MEVSRQLHSFLQLLLLLTFAPQKIETSALFGSFCRTVQGEIPNTQSYTWSIPLFPAGTYVTLYAKAASDLLLALVPTSNLAPSTSTKYRVVLGASSSTCSLIGPIDVTTNWARQITNGILNDATYVPLWVSWSGGVISGGTGKVVGQNTVMNYTDPSPTPINYLLIGGWLTSGNVTITYCYQPRIFDQTSPIDRPSIASVVATELECGRTCDQDVQCQGYTVTRHHVTPLGATSCMIYHTISGLQYDPNNVLFVVGNYTRLTM